MMPPRSWCDCGADVLLVVPFRSGAHSSNLLQLIFPQDFGRFQPGLFCFSKVICVETLNFSPEKWKSGCPTPNTTSAWWKFHELLQCCCEPLVILYDQFQSRLWLHFGENSLICNATFWSPVNDQCLHCVMVNVGKTLECLIPFSWLIPLSKCMIMQMTKFQNNPPWIPGLSFRLVKLINDVKGLLKKTKCRNWMKRCINEVLV